MEKKGGRSGKTEKINRGGRVRRLGDDWKLEENEDGEMEGGKAEM